MNILFQSTPFRVKKDLKQTFEAWFSLFQQTKEVELEYLNQSMEDCYRFVSKENHSFFSRLNEAQTMDEWMEELATYLPEDETCWVLETACHEETLEIKHQAVKITAQTISNHSLEEFVYRDEEDTIEACYQRLLRSKQKLNV